MTPAKKASGRTTKKAPAKAAAMPTIRPTRFASFNSAASEWEDEPIGFDLDGKVWLCIGSPDSKVIGYLRQMRGVGTLDFITACVIDKEGWEARLDENPVPGKLLTGIAQFLYNEYLGLTPKK